MSASTSGTTNTSGTIGTVSFTTDQLLGHAVRRAGKSSGALPEEVGEALTRIAYMWLSKLANRGVQMWTVERYTIGLIPNQIVYPLPIGTFEIQNLLYRTVSMTPADPLGVIADPAVIGTPAILFDQLPFNGDSAALPKGAWVGYDYQYGQPDPIPVGDPLYGSGFLPAVVSWMASANVNMSVAVDYADTLLGPNPWTEWFVPAGDPTPNNPGLIQSPAQQWVCRDMPQTPVPHRYWRLRVTSDPLVGQPGVALSQVQFGARPNEIVCARFNNDQYQQQNNKRSNPSRAPVNWWFQRKRQHPIIEVWPVPAYAFDQLVAWRYRQLQDPGDLTQQLELPQHWWQAAVSGLAELVLLELPDADLKRYPILQATAKADLAEAEMGERDDAPVMLSPLIGCYT